MTLCYSNPSSKSTELDFGSLAWEQDRMTCSVLHYKRRASRLYISRITAVSLHEMMLKDLCFTDPRNMTVLTWRYRTNFPPSDVVIVRLSDYRRPHQLNCIQSFSETLWRTTFFFACEVVGLQWRHAKWTPFYSWFWLLCAWHVVMRRKITQVSYPQNSV